MTTEEEEEGEGANSLGDFAAAAAAESSMTNDGAGCSISWAEREGIPLQCWGIQAGDK